MPSAPSPITSAPNVKGQPYDATASGADEPQSQPTTIYDAAGGSGAAEPWIKVQDGGAVDIESGRLSPGQWPGNGTSSAGPWKQT